MWPNGSLGTVSFKLVLLFLIECVPQIIIFTENALIIFRKFFYLDHIPLLKKL
jgi:hypothetical protein